jgi:hypothetical protein
MSVFSVPPVTEIRASFQHKPESYEVDLHPTRQAILKIRKKLIANLASLTCDIPNSNNNWKWVLMSAEEYLLSQCRQHGIDPNSKVKVKLGKETGKIFARPIVKPAGIYEAPETDNVAKVHIAESKHNRASANFTHYSHTNLACVLDILDAVPVALVTHIYPDEDDAHQASALEMLQALEKRFATLRATDVSKITDLFDAPYDTGGTIDEYLRRQNGCIKKLRDTKYAFNMDMAVLKCVHHMELLPQLTLQVRTWNAMPEEEHTWANFASFFTDAMQTLHYEEATLADAGIHNPSTTAVANLAHANSDHQALLLEHQAHLAALQQQIATLTATTLKNQSTVPPKTITVDAQTFAGSTVDTKSLVDIIKDTIIQQSKSSNRNRASTRNDTNRTSTTTRASRKYSNNNYCWTHGADIHHNHTSATCEHRSDGHQADATIDNRKGGSTKNLKLLRPHSNSS